MIRGSFGKNPQTGVNPDQEVIDTQHIYFDEFNMLICCDHYFGKECTHWCFQTFSFQCT